MVKKSQNLDMINTLHAVYLALYFLSFDQYIFMYLFNFSSLSSSIGTRFHETLSSSLFFQRRAPLFLYGAVHSSSSRYLLMYNTTSDQYHFLSWRAFLVLIRKYDQLVAFIFLSFLGNYHHMLCFILPST